MLRLGWIAWLPVALAVAITAGVSLAGGGMGGLTGGPGGCSANCTFSGTTTVGAVAAGGDFIPIGGDTYTLGSISGNKTWHEVATRSITPDTGLTITTAGATAAVTISNALKVTAAAGGGTITLSAGSGTATVLSGHRCVCSDNTAVAACKWSVSGTTLTITGTGTDVVSYFCF